MSDDPYVQALRTILDTGDRKGKQGSEVWVTDLTPVADGDFPELEVAFEIRVAREHIFQGAPRSGTTRVLFVREWLQASGYGDPAAYAPVVAKQVVRAAAALVDRARDGDDAAIEEPLDDIAAELPGRDALWSELEETLGHEAAGLTRISHGTFEVVDEDGEIFFVHTTPRDWYAYVVASERASRREAGILKTGRGGGPDLARSRLDETIAGRRDGEDHIVFFRDTVTSSVRAELPPVRSAEPERPAKKDKARRKAKARAKAARARPAGLGEAAGRIEVWDD